MKDKDYHLIAYNTYSIEKGKEKPIKLGDTIEDDKYQVFAL